MEITARPAEPGDLDELLRLYAGLEAEMAALERIWPLADGLPAPAHEAFAALLADPDASVVIGCIDGVPFGFLVGRREELQPQAAGALVGSIRYVYTQEGAREVGVGEAMMGAYLDAERAAGIGLFDAHVTPGQRLTKNFFESNGFSARSIVMHHDDRDDA